MEHIARPNFDQDGVYPSSALLLGGVLNLDHGCQIHQSASSKWVDDAE